MNKVMVPEMARNYPEEARPEKHYTILPVEIALDLRIENLVSYRILTWALGRSDDFTHTKASIAKRFGYSVPVVQRALRELIELGYVTHEDKYHKGRQGMASDWTFHYPPLDVGDNPLGITDRALLIEPYEQPPMEDSLGIADRALLIGPYWQGSTGRALSATPLTKKEGTKKEGTKNELTKNEVEPSSAAPTGEHLDVVQEEVEDHEPPTVATTPQTTDGKPVDPGATKPRSFAVMDEDQELPPPVVKAPRSFAIMDGDDGEPVTTETRQSHPRPSGDEQFDQFWVLYAKPKGKKAALDQWKIAIKKADPDVILAAVPGYVASNHDPKYRKDPERWLKGEHWTDGVIASPKTNGAHHVAYRDPTDLSVYRKSLRRTMP